MLHCCIYYFFLHKKHVLCTDGFSSVFLGRVRCHI